MAHNRRQSDERVANVAEKHASSSERSLKQEVYFAMLDFRVEFVENVNLQFNSILFKQCIETNVNNSEGKSTRKKVHMMSKCEQHDV